MDEIDTIYIYKLDKPKLQGKIIKTNCGLLSTVINLLLNKYNSDFNGKFKTFMYPIENVNNADCSIGVDSPMTILE